MVHFHSVSFITIYIQIKFCGEDMSPIYEQIDPELLPEELGGTRPPFNCEHTIAFVEGTNDTTGTEV